MVAVRAIALAVIAAAAACGAGSPAREPRAQDPVHPLSEPDPVRSAAGEGFLLPLPGAAFYSTDAGRVPTDDGAAALRADLESKARAKGLEPDSRLVRAAATISAALEAKVPFSASLVNEALEWHGAPEPSPWAGLVREAEPARLAASLGDWLARRADEGANRYGLASRSVPGGAEVVALALSSRIGLTPVPREVRVGETVVLHGTVSPPYRDVSFAVTRPSGEVLEPASTARGHAFKTEVPLDAPGLWTIEIVARSATGPMPLANLKVAVGIAHERRLRIARASAEGSAVADPVSGLLALVNESRTASGLKPVALSKDLSRVAQAYSEEMARTGVIAHVSPESGSVADRVAAAGLAYPLLTENLAAASGAAEVHEGLMGSPAHRANILDPAAREIGIGVAPMHREGETALLVTEIFAGRPGPIARDAAKQFLAAINAARGGQRLPALVADKGLEELARRNKDACFAPKGSPATAAYKDGAFRSVRMVAITTGSLAEAASEKVFADRAITHVGLAVSQGSDETLGNGAICVVVLLGRR
ncbi:MAG: CAP domain-containing protein [Deltaproteobacteria bacterium]|nr:CAP domain-containing protein [Deltaproteobacteria bacterium]